MKKTYTADEIATPLGRVWVVVDARGALVLLEFEGGRNAPIDRHDLEQRYARSDGTLAWNAETLRPVAVALREYFAGRRERFELPVSPAGSTFQKRVWEELCRIPFGRTLSYGELAERVGEPGAARAVGRANATNPVSIVVPCHRVVGADGKLTGYGGGLDRKRALLELEGAL